MVGCLLLVLFFQPGADRQPDLLQTATTMSRRRSAALALHATAAYIMYWGYTALDNSPAGESVRAQECQHFRFLTIHG